MPWNPIGSFHTGSELVLDEEGGGGDVLHVVDQGDDLSCIADDPERPWRDAVPYQAVQNSDNELGLWGRQRVAR